ncbi:MAG: sigma-70 family RNA polymerase sigma factor [Anaerolineae bacterium]|nr:sigma-70 family RNA polymerase sigma factor [Anaerolineae bacterium]
MNDLQAILRLKFGDIGGLDALVARYQVRALRTAFLITQDAALAQDVVQDAFLSAYRAIHGFQLGRPFAPWFMRIVVNGAIQTARRGQHYTALDTDEDDDLDLSAGISAVSLEQTVEAAQTEAAIWAALADLTPERRAVIVLRYYLELSENEMAAHLAIPVGTVKSRLHAAKRQLRDRLTPEYRTNQDGR